MIVSFYWSCFCYDSSTEQTKCEREADEAGPLIPGAFIPTCTDTGDYEAMQCHGSTGHCWCVNVEGEELEGTRIRGQPECERMYSIIGNWDSVHYCL